MPDSAKSNALLSRTCVTLYAMAILSIPLFNCYSIVTFLALVILLLAAVRTGGRLRTISIITAFAVALVTVHASINRHHPTREGLYDAVRSYLFK